MSTAKPTYIDKARRYHTAVSAYDIETVRAMVREEYIQHNIVIPNGREAFLALLPILQKHNSKIQNLRIFEDGSHVIMHHLWSNAAPFGAEQKIAFHIIRFDEVGLIAEHWSVMTDQAPPNPSGRTLADGPTNVTQSKDSISNKRNVAELFARLTTQEPKNYEPIFARFFASDFHQHHPHVKDGIQGYGEAIDRRKLDVKYFTLHKVFGSGNFVLSISEGTLGATPSALYDLFRFENGLIAEHWNVYQTIPVAHPANANTMFGF